MAVAVQVGILPQLGPSVYQDQARISPISSLQVAGPNTGIEGGAFGGSISSTGPNGCASLETEDYLIKYSSVVNRHAT